MALQVSEHTAETVEFPRGPNPVDLHVGSRVRMRRKMLGISQERLADALGLTFQQVQKYERGTNRVSASKLYEIASFLSTPVSYFFEGLSDPATGEAAASGGGEVLAHDFLMTSEGLELAGLFPRIDNAKLRRRVLDLVRALAEERAPA
jgi:transcriptional regulator with XRE-family HTH domain